MIKSDTRTAKNHEDDKQTNSRHVNVSKFESILQTESEVDVLPIPRNHQGAPIIKNLWNTKKAKNHVNNNNKPNEDSSYRHADESRHDPSECTLPTYCTCLHLRRFGALASTRKRSHYGVCGLCLTDGTPGRLGRRRQALPVFAPIDLRSHFPSARNCTSPSTFCFLFSHFPFLSRLANPAALITYVCECCHLIVKWKSGGRLNGSA
uniref:FLZ-type domain-containing protein n=1 Tax=Steinernema glaseri TaxID=37863 RepID=A0A1I7ZII1_9BILA